MRCTKSDDGNGDEGNDDDGSAVDEGTLSV